MRITSPVAAVVVLLLATAAAPAAAAVIDVPITPLIIRLYAPEPDESAVKEAHAILADAGFAPEWVRCAPGDPVALAARCAVPLDSAELAVRIVDGGTPQRSSRLPLGYSLIDPRTRGGSLATIYLDRVRWLAAEAGTALTALLGRAMAHEIGHLLLGTTAHARVGLMRAVWSREAVRDGRPAEWRFLAGEARQMRAAALSRSTVGQFARHLVWGD
jgi:hypothetical protein